MQYLKISNNTTLAQLTDRVGSRNVEYVLAENNLKRTAAIGKEFKAMCDKVVETAKANQKPGEPLVDWQRRFTILNTMTKDSDVFETACSLNDTGWCILSELNTFPKMLKIPYDIFTLPDAVDVLGDGRPVDSVVYSRAATQLTTYPHIINPAVFSEYSSGAGVTTSDVLVGGQTQGGMSASPFQWFPIPWGQVTLWSSITDKAIEFPVYPEEVSDGRRANFSTMPDLLYQYEPWQVYQSSGPRTSTYLFDMHRDMWTGDHRDGKANELVRFCEAQCYPEYKGSAINVPTVTLYVAGKPLITGVMTETRTKWDGPLGLDGYYLHFTLELDIVEVSDVALDHNTVMSKALIY